MGQWLTPVNTTNEVAGFHASHFMLVRAAANNLGSLW
jgi:hypothetical protein